MEMYDVSTFFAFKLNVDFTEICTDTSSKLSENIVLSVQIEAHFCR